MKKNDLGIKAVIDELAQRRQNYLAQLKPGQSIVRVSFADKTFHCVYMRHTRNKVTVQTTVENFEHLFSNGPLCLSGTSTLMNLKFRLDEIQIT